MQTHGEQESLDLSTAGGSPAELEECRALRAFYRAMGGKRWYRQDGWSTADRDAAQVRLGDFEGVTVRRGEFTGQIRLANNRVWTIRRKFERSWRTLSSLRYLTVLDLSRNYLRGRLPQVLFEMPTLEDIDLHGNKFFGTIPADFGRLPQLKRLRLRDNMLSGSIPEEVKNMPTLELLDCGNNDLRDLSPAWACMGTAYAGVGDPYPAQMYLFVMDAPPNSYRGGLSAYAREAQAKLRASGLIQWHLDKVRRESTCESLDVDDPEIDVEGGKLLLVERLDAGAVAPAAAGAGSATVTSRDAGRQISGSSASTPVADIQVQLVTLPNHWRAKVEFDVKTSGSPSRTIAFGTDGGIPGCVFGAAPNDSSTNESFAFPHDVIEISGGDAANAGSNAPVQRHGGGPFALKTDVHFTDSWEEAARRNDRCNNCCYNGLHRYGLKRARNFFIFFALAILISELVSSLVGDTAGVLLYGITNLMLYAFLMVEIIGLGYVLGSRLVSPVTRSSRWANMPILSFAVEPAREEA